MRRPVIKVMVVGATGTIGKAVVEALSPRHEVQAVEGSATGKVLDAVSKA